MNATFEALAKFDEQNEKKVEPENTAQVDFSSIVGRLNGLQTVVEELQKQVSSLTTDNVPRGTTDENVLRGTTAENVPQNEPTTEKED